MEVQFLTFLAESAYKLRKVEEAFYYFEELLLLQPENFPVMNNYSYYMALEETTLERAEELSYATIVKYPDNPTYLDTYAWILYKLKRYSDAKKYIQKAMQNEVEDPDIYYHYAMILCKEGERDESSRFFEKAINAGFSDKNKIENARQRCEE
jgi:tetratricopeptide (TPR) repeat protein